MSRAEAGEPWVPRFLKIEGRFRGPRIRLPACISRGAFLPPSYGGSGAHSESPTLARRFPSQVRGTRPYRLAPPLPVLSSLKPDHLLSAVTPTIEAQRG